MSHSDHEDHVEWVTHHIRDVATLWGELRALLALDDPSPEAFLELCAYAWRVDREHYEARWLPYLEARAERLPPLLAFNGHALARFGYLYPKSVRVVAACGFCGRAQGRCGC